MRPEDEIESKVCEYAESKGLEHRKLGWIGRRNAPDRIYWGFDVPVFMIEFKAPGEKAKGRQLDEIISLRDSGTHVHECDDVEKGKQMIDQELEYAASFDR